MKIDSTDRFHLELLVCMALSDVKFTEHNDLTTSAKRLISYEFPRDLSINIDDVCFIINELKKSSYKVAEHFIKSFARKDTELFRKLAIDQAKDGHYRIHNLGVMRGIVLSVAAIYSINYSDI